MERATIVGATRVVVFAALAGCNTDNLQIPNGQPGGLDMAFQFEEDACEFALGLGTRVEVLEPPSLRGRVLRAAESVVAFYADVAARA